MAAIKSQHSKVFERLAAEYTAGYMQSMAAGIPENYPAYRQMVGQLQGMADALRISEAADHELSGDA